MRDRTGLQSLDRTPGRWSVSVTMTMIMVVVVVVVVIMMMMTMTTTTTTLQPIPTAWRTGPGCDRWTGCRVGGLCAR